MNAEKDVENWRFKSRENFQVAQKRVVPNKFSIIVRQVGRDFSLAKKKLPTVDHVEVRCTLSKDILTHENIRTS